QAEGYRAAQGLRSPIIDGNGTDPVAPVHTARRNDRFDTADDFGLREELQGIADVLLPYLPAESHSFGAVRDAWDFFAIRHCLRPACERQCCGARDHGGTPGCADDRGYIWRDGMHSRLLDARFGAHADARRPDHPGTGPGGGVSWRICTFSEA